MRRGACPGHKNVPEVQHGQPLPPNGEICRDDFRLRRRVADAILPLTLAVERKVYVWAPLIAICMPEVDFFDGSPAKSASAYRSKVTADMPSPTYPICRQLKVDWI